MPGHEPRDLGDDEATHGGIGDALKLVAQLDRLGDGEVAQTNMLGKPDSLGVVDMVGLTRRDIENLQADIAAGRSAAKQKGRGGRTTGATVLLTRSR